MRIDDKIDQIEAYLDELDQIKPLTFETYLSDFKTKAACERYLEKIIESIIDISFLIIKDKGLKIPEEDKQAFDLLLNEKIISPELVIRLKEAKGMRNILAHEYGIIDDEIVFDAITTEISRDAAQFIECVKRNVYPKPQR